MFGANAFAWAYPAQAYVGTTGIVKTDSDTPSLADLVAALTSAVSSTDTGSETEAVASNNPSSTDSASLAETASAIAGGPNAFESDQGTVASAVSALNVALSSSDTSLFSESPPAVSTPDHRAISSSDTATMTEAQTNSSGGLGNSFFGVVIAFGNDALDATPSWTRLDDPNGTT